VIRLYDEAGNVIETHEQAGDFREFSSKNNGNREIVRIRSIRGRHELSERRRNPRLLGLTFLAKTTTKRKNR
jgi:hypothetical protein